MLARYLMIALAAWPSVLAAQRTASAQEGRFTVGVSVTAHQWKDQVLNRARHDGWFPTLDVAHDRLGPAARARFRLQLVFSPVASRFDPGKDSFAAGVELYYRRTYRVGREIGDTGLRLGGQAEVSSDFAYFENWDDSHFYWLTA